VPLRSPTPMNRPTPAGAPSRAESPTPRDAPRLQEAPRPPILSSGAAGESDSKSTGANWVWVYEKLYSAIKVRHYSSKTLQAYKIWIQQFQTYTRSKDARLVSVEDVKGFLSFLAIDRHVAASSQNQAFNALLFLFRHVLEKDFGRVEGVVVRAKRRPYIPVVLSRQEVDQVIRHLEYHLSVHDGKGQKDRTVPLPELMLSDPVFTMCAGRCPAATARPSSWSANPATRSLPPGRTTARPWPP